MVDILHRIGVRGGDPERVYDALTTVAGLAGWWTDDTSGEPEVGGVLRFRFPQGGFDMEVVESVPAKRVLWRVVDGPEEWIGTTVDWELRTDGEWTTVLFTVFTLFFWPVVGGVAVGVGLGDTWFDWRRRERPKTQRSE